MNNYLKLGNGRIVGNYSSPENEDWFEEFKDTKENYLAFLNAAYDAMKEDSHIYIMFDTFSLLTLAPLVRDVFQVKNLIVWNKVNMGLGHYFRRQHETILFATKGKKKLLTKSVSDVWEAKRKTPQYPTQKPVEIFEKMITASVRGKANVCDPFVGSGSSAIATLKHDCNFYGCDISLRAVTLTKKRVEAFKRTGIDILEINGKH
jgi:site-specific DNA-methyltransferase (adenine-specific)